MTVPKGGKGGLSFGDDQGLTKIILYVGLPHSYKRCVTGPKHNICFLPSITGLAYKRKEATKFGCRDAFRHYGSSHLRAMTEGSS